MANHFNNRVGYRFKNSQDEWAEIAIYSGANDLWVRFDGNKENELVHTTFQRCKTGNVKNPNSKSICGVGYLGFGKYKSREGRKITKSYQTWASMINRCYGYSDKNKSYEVCEVCEEWHNYQNFAKWYEDNYYEVKGEVMQLDKDWLVRGNKVYSPETCIFAPQKINALLVKCVSKKKGKNLPIGVMKDGKKFRAECVTKDKPYLGSFDTVEEAFQAYKEQKEQYTKEIAEQYKNKIPQELYEAMYNRKIKIED
nr:MAG TPA: hypothetical protein [Caudoviricetes sp.]